MGRGLSDTRVLFSCRAGLAGRSWDLQLEVPSAGHGIIQGERDTSASAWDSLHSHWQSPHNSSNNFPGSKHTFIHPCQLVNLVVCATVCLWLVFSLKASGFMFFRKYLHLQSLLKLRVILSLRVILLPFILKKKPSPQTWGPERKQTQTFHWI